MAFSNADDLATQIEAELVAALTGLLDGWIDQAARQFRAEPTRSWQQQAEAVTTSIVVRGALKSAAGLFAKLKVPVRPVALPSAQAAISLIGTSAAHQARRVQAAVAGLDTEQALIVLRERREKLDRWVQGISIQATTVTINGAQEDAAGQVVRDNEVTDVLRTWVTRHDEKVRAAHAEVNGQVRPLGITFLVGGEAMRYPGDTLASPALTAHCRCRLRYTAKKTGRFISPPKEE